VGSNPVESNEFLTNIKIRSTTSFGGDIKLSAPFCKILLLLLLWLHGPFSLALASLRIADHSFLSCALILHLFIPRALI
jgi:hypothetical protein